MEINPVAVGKIMDLMPPYMPSHIQSVFVATNNQPLNMQQKVWLSESESTQTLVLFSYLANFCSIKASKFNTILK